MSKIGQEIIQMYEDGNIEWDEQDNCYKKVKAIGTPPELLLLFKRLRHEQIIQNKIDHFIKEIENDT